MSSTRSAARVFDFAVRPHDNAADAVAYFDTLTRLMVRRGLTPPSGPSTAAPVPPTCARRLAWRATCRERRRRRSAHARAGRAPSRTVGTTGHPAHA
jgi:hypothetical protein